jgi:hypothetical protein
MDTAIVAAVVGVGGLVIGAAVSAIFQRSSWFRDKRTESCIALLDAFHEFDFALASFEGGGGLREAGEAFDTALEKVKRVDSELVIIGRKRTIDASKRVLEASRSLVNVINGATTAARLRENRWLVQEWCDADKAESDFLNAARHDIGVQRWWPVDFRSQPAPRPTLARLRSQTREVGTTANRETNDAGRHEPTP